MIIARLAAGLHCYEPERADAVWARLRHLGARRSQLTTGATAQVNQIRDLLECAWPAVLGASASRFARPPGARRWRWWWTGARVTWAASAAWARPGSPPRCAVSCRAGARPGRACGSCAPSSPPGRSAGVIAHRPGALERVHLAMGDWRDTRARLADAEARMVAVLDDLGLTELVTTIAGLTPAGAAAILAETGDPARFASPRSLVKHAGLCPRDNTSGGYQGKTSISGRGRPRLRVAAWRAVWAALPNNPVMAARFTHLTTRQDNRLARQQARTACAAALLRWIHVVITRRVTWDPPSPPGPHHCPGPHEPAPAPLTTASAQPAAAAQDPGGASPNAPSRNLPRA